ncbi:MAG: HD domain-containing protein [Candidatus Aenigmatarchaeota archaeon]
MTDEVFFGVKDSELIVKIFGKLEESGVNTPENINAALSPNTAVNPWISPEERDMDLPRISIGVKDEETLRVVHKKLIEIGGNERREPGIRYNSPDLHTYSSEIEFDGKVVEIVISASVFLYDWDGKREYGINNPEIWDEIGFENVDVNGTMVPVFSADTVASIKMVLEEAVYERQVKDGYHGVDYNRIRRYVGDFDTSLYRKIARESIHHSIREDLEEFLGEYVEPYRGVFNSYREMHLSKGNGLIFHSYQHGYSTMERAIQLIRNTSEEIDVKVIIFAALLHDIGNIEGRAGHAESGSRLAEDLLAKHHVPEDISKRVAGIIREHDSFSQEVPTSTESKIVRDADLGSFAEPDQRNFLWGNIHLIKESGISDPHRYFENTKAMFQNLLCSIDPDFFNGREEEISSLYNRFSGFRYLTDAAKRIYRGSLIGNYNLWVRSGERFCQDVYDMINRGEKYIEVERYLQ